MTGSRKGTIRLQERDRRLLAELALLRLIDREQAKLAGGFHSTTRANTRLLKLTKSGYLRRSFVGTVSSGRKAVYMLSKLGAAVAGIDAPVLAVKSDQSLVAGLYVSHMMKIAEVLVLLKFGMDDPERRLTQWNTFYQPLSATVPIIPDGFFLIVRPDGEHAFFLEVDMGTEALSEWRKKARAYLTLALSGRLSALHVERFKVLVLVSSERRLETIRKTVAEVTTKLFFFATFEVINRDCYWSPVWARPAGDQRQSPLP